MLLRWFGAMNGWRGGCVADTGFWVAGVPVKVGARVERARRLVEDQDRRVAQDRARDRDALLLAAGEAVAALADHGVIAVGQARDQVVDARRARGLLELRVARVGTRETQVVAHGGV